MTLTKKRIASIRVQVGMAIDRSGSMDNLYRNNTMQEYVNRIIPLGLMFDDNGAVDTWAFHNSAFPTGTITAKNTETYIRDQVLKINPSGTAFVPVLSMIFKHYFEAQQESTKALEKTGFFKSLFGQKTGAYPKTNELTARDPVYLIFQTDGVNSDTTETERLLAQYESQGIYVQFVGIGNEDFHFIKRMADKYNNVGFFCVKDLENTSDETLYDLLINAEFKAFMKSRFPNNITEI
jgi:hypothetical protein